MDDQERSNSVITSAVALVNQLVAINWKRWTPEEWRQVTDTIKWTERPLEKVLPTLSRIQYLLDSGLPVTATFRCENLVSVYVECYTYPFSLVRPNEARHEKGLRRIKQLFRNCLSLLTKSLNEPVFLGSRDSQLFPASEETALRLAMWHVSDAHLMLQIRKDDTDLPYVLAIIVRPN